MTERPLQHKPPKSVHVAVYDTLADWEVGLTIAHINNESWQRQPGRYRVVTVGPSTTAVTSMGGLHITPDIALPELDPADSAMLILPGADTWMTGDNAPFAVLARRFLDAGVPVAAICGATAGLAFEGLLDDRRHTSNAAEFLSGFTGYAGAEYYVDELAVTDGDLITATATAPADFARHIFAKLDLYAPPVLASWYKLYGRQDPAGFYELMSASAA